MFSFPIARFRGLPERVVILAVRILYEGEELNQKISNLYHCGECIIEMDEMTVEPIPPHVLCTFDIRPVLMAMDMYAVRSFATQRWQELENRNPDHAFIYKMGSPTAQKLEAIQAQVIDDFIIHTYNSFEHTWIQRDQRHLTPKELDWYARENDARRALFRAVQLNHDYAGMFAHYQRIGDSMFLLVPKY